MRNAECGPPGLELNQCIRVHTGIALIPDLNITLDHYQSNDLCPKLHLRSHNKQNKKMLDISPHHIITVRLFGPHKGRSLQECTQ